MSEIRLATLSTVMLSREDLQLAHESLLEEADRYNNATAIVLTRVADALWSITNPSGVQAIACAETVGEAERG